MWPNNAFFCAAVTFLLLMEVCSKIPDIDAEEDHLNGAVLDLLRRVKDEHNYGYALIIDGVEKSKPPGRHQSCCVFHECLRSLETPAIVMRTRQMAMLDSSIYSKDVIVLSCHYTNYNNELFYNTDLQMTLHIILTETETEISTICEQLVHNEVYNAIVIARDFGCTKSYFVCELKFLTEKYGRVSQRTFGRDGKVFEERFHNMRGSKIFTHPDQMLPRSFVYKDERGNLKMDGYVGNILTTFAHRLNATLAFRWPVEPGVKTFFETLENATRDGVLDIATGVRPIDLHLDNISYPVEFMTFCYMIPLPSHVPVNEIYFMIVDGKATIIILCMMVIYAILITLALHRSTKFLTFMNVFCNDKSIRGLLGQSFIMPNNPHFALKLVCFLICYSSVLLSTCYQAYLQSYLTEPPPQKLIRTYDDIRDAGMKIIASSRELKYIDPLIVKRYADVFDFQSNYTKYVEMRSKMDNRFAYSVTSAMWYVYYEKQKLFRRPAFYYSSHLCLKDSFLVAMPVRPGLPYRSLFNSHMVLLRDVGLMQHWISNKYFTMLRLGLIDFDDLSSDTSLEMEIILDDFLWIWVLYSTCACSCIFVFGIELLFQRIFKKQ